MTNEKAVGRLMEAANIISEVREECTAAKEVPLVNRALFYAVSFLYDAGNTLAQIEVFKEYAKEVLDGNHPANQ